jgi:UPF0271 protein
MELDLNCDLGECGPADAELMPLVSSANVACGFHAGDPSTMADALALAARHDVVVGAHPGHADRANFGRVEINRTHHQVFTDCIYQLGALAALAKAAGVAVKYLKPHGALYHQAGRGGDYANAVASAARLFGLAVLGLPGSRLEALCQARGVRFVPEGYADRRYRPDGTLVPRTEPDAFVHAPDEAVAQVERLVREGRVRTVCVHGDNPQAVAFVRAVRAALIDRGILVRPFA